MSQTSIGHLFYELGLRPDKHSFETGNKLIDGTVGSIQKLVGIARNAAVVMGTTAIATGAFENAELKTSVALGISTEKLDKWTAAANIAGAKIGTITTGMTKLQTVMTNAKFTGDGLEALQKSLAPLEIDVGKILTMDVSDAYVTILNKAKSMVQDGKMNDQDAIVLLNQIMGAGDFYAAMTSKGMKLDSLLERAEGTQHRTAEDTKAGAMFWTEIQETKEHMASLTKLFGDRIGAELTDDVQKLNKWITDHGPEIEKAIKDVAETIGKLVDKLTPFVEVAGDSLVETWKALQAATNGDWGTAAEHAGKAGDSTGYAIAALLTGQPPAQIKKQTEINTSATQELAKLWLENGKKNLKYDNLPKHLQDYVTAKGRKNFKYIDDGIIRPNGQVTQVAPDDWVFAARNISDLAAAFIPQQAGNYAEANNFVINQTFNIGSGGNLAQTIKSQAYNGTRDGLMQAMTQSSKRLQMMSGTR